MLFWVGASLLPLGLVVIVLGWYGVANTPFGYDQQSYMISGGFGGLALTFVGGFLYFGSWLARIAEDNREASRRLADTLLVLADVTSRSASLNDRGVDVSAHPGDGRRRHHDAPPRLLAHRAPRGPAPGRRAPAGAGRLPGLQALSRAAGGLATAFGVGVTAAGAEVIASSGLFVSTVVDVVRGGVEECRRRGRPARRGTTGAASTSWKTSAGSSLPVASAGIIATIGS